jgi:hypothetical protein
MVISYIIMMRLYVIAQYIRKTRATSIERKDWPHGVANHKPWHTTIAERLAMLSLRLA